MTLVDTKPAIAAVKKAGRRGNARPHHLRTLVNEIAERGGVRLELVKAIKLHASMTQKKQIKNEVFWEK